MDLIVFAEQMQPRGTWALVAAEAFRRGFQGGGPERPGKPVLRAWRGRSEDLPLGQTAATLARPAQWAGWSLPPGSLACEAATSPCRRQGTTAHPPLRWGCAVKSSPVPTGGKGEARKFSLPVFSGLEKLRFRDLTAFSFLEGVPSFLLRRRLPIGSELYGVSSTNL